MLRSAGFENISVKPVGASRSLIRDWMPEMDLTDYVLSASIEAFKPSHGEPAEAMKNTIGEILGAAEHICCGGPPAEGVDACCELDAIEKGRGNGGCGCNRRAPGAD